MTYEVWNVLFLGMVTTMLLFNVVQWFSYRERIYGLYTAYILVWVGYFLIRGTTLDNSLTTNARHFVRIAGPMLAYFVYYDFTNAFIGIRERVPSLLKLFRVSQAFLLAYIGLEVWFCFLSDYWREPIHEIIHSVVRITLAVVAWYIIFRIFRVKSYASRYFITGSAMLVLGGLAAMLLTIFASDEWRERPEFWHAPLTYMQVGIILELMFFSLGLAQRQRQVIIKKAVIEQELAREREKRHREQLEAELAVQRLKQEVSEVQMRVLQAQLNPHFLFNSLNSLSSLISDAPDKAEEFVDELSKVYRYLLRTNEYELTTLETEIDFIHSYYHLLKTRYGQGIELELSVDRKYLNHKLPPLTLQLLVENAVKHNIVSSSRPLTIQIRTNALSTLVVSNNLQRKSRDRVISTKKGLLTIMTKYELLHQPEVDIRETADEFEVVVPLIGPDNGL
ncbi:Sensor protein lytS [Fibrisoma limi BUZ 3]|uniref:Sensor protein lytS n=1 Tax=Fibrisoma limi BUZ 3 TaxID=1185876 RepID=I2GT68_9BACT|nr:histidine kinase [Fibrisoma limi]CCH57097.1 Sensor protein lytS [Fibrisoma limi BUZ 3]